MGGVSEKGKHAAEDKKDENDYFISLNSIGFCSHFSIGYDGLIKLDSDGRFCACLFRVMCRFEQMVR